MSAVPQCKYHPSPPHKAMVAGDYGFYCPNRTDDPKLANRNGYCKYQVKYEQQPQLVPQPQAAAPTGVRDANTGTATDGTGSSLRVAALTAAVEYCRGYGDADPEVAVSIAKRFETYLEGGA